MSSSPTDESGTPASLIEVTMPQMGVSVAEGTILMWHKQPGDWVEMDELICEISTDKVDSEIPSPATGRLARIMVEPNQTVAVGTPLAEIDTSAKPGEPHLDERDRAPGAAASEPPRAPTAGGDAERRPAPDRSRVFSPVVQRIAAEHGIDLEKIKGTGVGGRVRKKDLLAHIESKGGEPALHIDSPYGRVAEGDGGAETARVEARREPMSVMRKQVAEHMLRSRRTAAHCTTVAEVDMGAVAERREQLRPSFAERDVPLTFLAFVARATVAALREHPALNASLEGEEILYHSNVNLGIAVALDGGLIVPVIQRAQRLSLEGIAAAIADLSSRARSKRLSPDEVQGGTFTITNPGQFGTVLATPIINQPQVAILDLEAVVKRPVVVERVEGDSVAVRPVANLCLSFDHRVLDGVDAARFLGTLKSRLERWVDDA